MFAITGAFAINNSVFDIGVLGVMGIVGYFMEKNGYPVAPIVLGLVLGPILEQNFMTSMIKSDWNLCSFLRAPHQRHPGRDHGDRLAFPISGGVFGKDQEKFR